MTDPADTDAEQAGDQELDEDAVDGTEDGVDGAENPESNGPETAPDGLIARVATVDEEAAAEVEALWSRAADLEAELDEAEAVIDDRETTLAEQEATIEELESKLKRARADFQNYKKRAKQQEEELKARATEDLVERLLDVRDNLVRAVEQDDDVEVRDGVEATLATFDRVLDAENVSAIEPDAGGDVDPERHEVVHRTESEEPEGAIAEVYRPGYEMAGRVLRPAQVTVSEGAPEPSDESGSGGSDGTIDG